MSPIQTAQKTNYRWIVCGMLFLATTINYMDRQVLSLTWKDFIAPEFAWNDEDYGRITSIFSLVYALSMLVVGRLTDVIGVKRGYSWAIGVWSLGAILHAFCGIATCIHLTPYWPTGFEEAKELLYSYGVKGLPITTVSIFFFMACRIILAIGQAGNFPAAVKATAEYFPKRDWTYAISIFNNGASVGALLAPLTIPLLANEFGWEMAFFIVGAIGYLWMLLWLMMYYRPQDNKMMNMAEREYIEQDTDKSLTTATAEAEGKPQEEKRIGFWRCFTYPQTWALFIGKFITDGVWWFFLFWTPVYISDFYSYTSDSQMGIALIFTLYLVSMLSIAGGYLPTYLVNHQGMQPYSSRMRAMLYYAVIQLLGFFTVPMGAISPWLFVVVIGILGASHQSWSANMFSMVGDFFPKSTIGTITGIIGMAGGIGAYIIMIYSSRLFAYAEALGTSFSYMGYYGKQDAYMIVFSLFAVLYLIGWGLMMLIIPNPDTANRKKLQ